MIDQNDPAYELSRKIAKIPRVRLGEYPSPLDPLPRLSEALGLPLWIKRDDLIGPATGGNKCRKLEFLLAEAIASGAGKLVTFGGMQSNHARMTAAAGRRFGFETHIFCFEPRPHRLSGNMLLNQVFGAKLHFLPIGGGGGGLTLETANRLVKWLARLMAGSNYFIPVGGHSWLGCLGYAAAGLEIDRQARERSIENALLVLAAGTGGTLAGLMAGLALCGSRLQLLGIDVGKLWRSFPDSIARLASEISMRLDSPLRFERSDVPLIESAYVGDKYGMPTVEGNAAMMKVARMEGILLDPVYTAKAFSGLLDRIAGGEITRDTPVIFLHTGGLPGIFGFRGELLGLE